MPNVGEIWETGNKGYVVERVSEYLISVMPLNSSDPLSAQRFTTEWFLKNFTPVLPD